MTAATVDHAAPASVGPIVERMRAIALRRLVTMYRPEERLFVFRVRREGDRLAAEGLSARYTAIVLIALARESAATQSAILHGHSPSSVLERVRAAAAAGGSLGDVALACWAGVALGIRDEGAFWNPLLAFDPVQRPCATVDLAWTLTALAAASAAEVSPLRDQVAVRLMALYHDASAIFPHVTGGGHRGRSHVACFADQIYPILALAEYVARTGHVRALHIAERAALQLCERQGPDGQWWWHYDTRTGAIVERYPVYAVHQDGMAPMALRALARVSALDFRAPLVKGLEWLESAPEIGGSSLIDDAAGVIWRKVGRRERRKASRYLQAVATRIWPGITVPGLDRLFPPGAIDYECRPYHLGWLLYAFPPDGGAQDVRHAR